MLMPRPASKMILLAILGISVLAISLRFFSLLSFPDSQATLEKGALLDIHPDQTYTQTFVADRDNLHAIQFLVRTPGIKAGDAMRIKLADASCATALRQGTLQVPFLDSDNLYVFDFPSVKDSLGKKYCAVLTFHTTNKTKSLRLFTTTDDNPDTTLTATDSMIIPNQSLSMRSVYVNSSVWQNLRELDQRISQYKPWFLKGLSIALIGLLFVVSSLTLILALIGLKSEDTRE